LIRSKPLPKGVGHVGDAPVLPGLDLAVERAAQGRQSRHHPVEIPDDEIQMDGSPMALEVARDLRSAEVGHGGPVRQQEDRDIRARQLDPTQAEATLHREAETPAIEFDPTRRFGHIDVGMDDKHGGDRSASQESDLPELRAKGPRGKLVGRPIGAHLHSDGRV